VILPRSTTTARLRQLSTSPRKRRPDYATPWPPEFLIRPRPGKTPRGTWLRQCSTSHSGCQKKGRRAGTGKQRAARVCSMRRAVVQARHATVARPRRSDMPESGKWAAGCWDAAGRPSLVDWVNYRARKKPRQWQRSMSCVIAATRRRQCCTSPRPSGSAIGTHALLPPTTRTGSSGYIAASHAAVPVAARAKPASGVVAPIYMSSLAKF
jgi:hypothetical protein